MHILIYGANGYTGKVILEHAESYGIKPVIAGRSSEKLKPLAEKHALDYLAFDLSDHANIVDNIKDFQILLNCAGPFARTAKPLVKACLEAGVHYLDITGEIAVFEWIKTQHQKAVDAQIILLPGVGFDVVPTDCVAGFLHNEMPDASHLTLAFAPIGGTVSHGTATTLVEGLGQPGAIRAEGKIQAVPLGHKGRMFDFGGKSFFAMTIPWGDVSTAYSTTGIPNIEVYTRVPKMNFQIMKFQKAFNWLLRKPFIKKRLFSRIDKNISGPNAEQRAKGASLVLGIVRNAQGDEMKALLTGPEGYDYTVHASLLAVNKIQNASFSPGYHTPTSIFGYDFATEIPSTEMKMIP